MFKLAGFMIENNLQNLLTRLFFF